MQPIAIAVIVAAGSDKSTDINLSKSKCLLDNVDNIEGTNDGGWACSAVGSQPVATGDLLIHYAMF